ncbi:hypothetical protein GWI33_022527, partial [Rhynchophorus ferrugineus]
PPEHPNAPPRGPTAPLPPNPDSLNSIRIAPIFGRYLRTEGASIRQCSLINCRDSCVCLCVVGTPVLGRCPMAGDAQWWGSARQRGSGKAK